MANGKSLYGVGVSDWYKSNGSDNRVFPVGPSLTRQEFAEECDINSIMRRYEIAGATINGLPRAPNVVPMYVDFTATPATLMDFMCLMQDADKAFMTLPAVVRKEFDNDPMMFVDFASDPANLDQMRTWGLAPPAKPSETPPAPTASPAPVAAPSVPVAPVGPPSTVST